MPDREREVAARPREIGKEADETSSDHERPETAGGAAQPRDQSAQHIGDRDPSAQKSEHQRLPHVAADSIARQNKSKGRGTGRTSGQRHSPDSRRLRPAGDTDAYSRRQCRRSQLSRSFPARGCPGCERNLSGATARTNRARSEPGERAPYRGYSLNRGTSTDSSKAPEATRPLRRSVGDRKGAEPASQSRGWSAQPWQPPHEGRNFVVVISRIQALWIFVVRTDNKSRGHKTDTSETTRGTSCDTSSTASIRRDLQENVCRA